MSRMNNQMVIMAGVELEIEAPGAAEWEETRFVFPCSWSDFFHPGADQWRAEAWDLIRATPHLLALPARYRFASIEPMLGAVDLTCDLGGTLWMGGQRGCGQTHSHSDSCQLHNHMPGSELLTTAFPWQSHHHHDNRCRQGLDWVICGGETGPGARPMHPDWARSLRDQCAEAGVPFFFKQWGEWVSTDEGWHDRPLGSYQQCWLDPSGRVVEREWQSEQGDENMLRVGRKLSGNILDGRGHEERLRVERIQNEHD